jgi:hypothetical protein
LLQPGRAAVLPRPSPWWWLSAYCSSVGPAVEGHSAQCICRRWVTRRVEMLLHALAVVAELVLRQLLRAR